MSRSEETLCLCDHRLVPEDMRDDSVTKWRCLICDAEHECASEYIDEQCQTGTSGHA